MIFVLVLVVIHGLSQPPVRMSDQDTRDPGAPLCPTVVTHLGATSRQSIFLAAAVFLPVVFSQHLYFQSPNQSYQTKNY